MGLVLLQFTLPDENTAEAFKELLIQSLRRSDCVTQNGKKFLAMLPETTEAESNIIARRILSRLKGGRITFEREKIF